MPTQPIWESCVREIIKAREAGEAAQWTIGKRSVQALAAGKPEAGKSGDLIAELADEVGLDRDTVDAYRRVELFYRTVLATPPRGGLAAFGWTTYRDIAGSFPNDPAGAVAFLRRLRERDTQPTSGTWPRRTVLAALADERRGIRVAGDGKDGRDHQHDDRLDEAGGNVGTRSPAERAAQVADFLNDPETVEAVAADRRATEAVERAAGETQRKMQSRVHAQTRTRLERDTAQHIEARLGSIRAELSSFVDQVAKITLETATRARLVTRAERVELAATALLTTLRGGGATDEALAEWLGEDGDTVGRD
jgi:hypothetical protein